MDLQNNYGDRLWVACLDLTDAPAVREVVGRAFDALGTIEVVINNAGYGLFGAMESTAKDVADFGIGVTIVEPGGAQTEFRSGSARLATIR